MSFAEDQIWLELLATGNEKDLADIAAEAGFGEPGRTATNLCLLHETLADPRLIIALTRHALTTADPDLALNNLERLSTRVDKSDLTIVFIDETSTRQLLTVLGASPFLSGILCRRASFFAGLFRKGQINQSKTEPQMCAELRQMIGDDADTAEMKKGLRTYKAEEMLRIGARDLCGMAELEEVTAELYGAGGSHPAESVRDLQPPTAERIRRAAARLCCRRTEHRRPSSPSLAWASSAAAN